MDKRVVKVALPVDLIKQMDSALLEGRGGLTTRDEFFREAVESFVTDITYPQALPEPGGPASSDEDARGGPTSAGSGPDESGTALLPPDITVSVPQWELDELRLADLAGTALSLDGRGAIIESDVAQPEDGPLLGLHNRDYPSFWAAHRLARYSVEDPVALGEFLRRVTNAAWVYAAELRSLEQNRTVGRLQASFPSNPKKQESAEKGFQSFAVGTAQRRPPEHGSIRVAGPLFAWRLCQLARREGELVIGLTETGWELLEQLEGLSLELPHSRAHADRFLSHLGKYAPGDRWGFDRVLLAAAEQPSRDQLLELVSEGRADWTPATASSIAQGYVARAREWGMVEPRLHKGRYSLTEFGRSRLEEVKA